jgi:hypothetical protein
MCGLKKTGSHMAILTGIREAAGQHHHITITYEGQADGNITNMVTGGYPANGENHKIF